MLKNLGKLCRPFIFNEVKILWDPAFAYPAHLSEHVREMVPYDSWLLEVECGVFLLWPTKQDKGHLVLYDAWQKSMHRRVAHLDMVLSICLSYWVLLWCWRACMSSMQQMTGRLLCRGMLYTLFWSRFTWGSLKGLEGESRFSTFQQILFRMSLPHGLKNTFF